ncbi:MAG: DUF1573 domain-containing protein, partial [Ignavibacteria bacterium]|nr:DUF1573 domain-containing protein [Ignavibacteria bacterium]
MKIFFFLLINTILAYSQPKLEVEKNINAGDHIRGREVVIEITFRNSGNQDLKITNVTTSCGCSSALLTNDLLKPGETGSLKFTFNGQGFGVVSKNLTIFTNEPETNHHTLTVTMNMVDAVSYNPQSIITEGKVGEEIIKTAEITNSLDKEVDILEVTANTPVIKVSADKNALFKGDKARLDIAIKIYEDSPINAAIIIRTT